jgi:hypothetical protein
LIQINPWRASAFVGVNVGVKFGSGKSIFDPIK